MDNLPIIPNNRKTSFRDSSRIDADNIKNLTLGELQESLIKSTIRAKGVENTSQLYNYGLAKPSSYSMLGYSNPNTVEEVASLKINILNWLLSQLELNESEPYNYLTLGAFRLWAKGIINLLGKSGDTETVDLYFCNNSGEKITSLDITPLTGEVTIYFKFCRKNFGNISAGNVYFITPLLDDLKAKDYTITVVNPANYVYSIKINLLQFQPKNNTIDFLLLYEESSYSVNTSLTVNIPEWSALLVSSTGNNSFTVLSLCIISGETVTVENLSTNNGSLHYYLIMLHNCYIYETLLDLSCWEIQQLRLATANINLVNNSVISTNSSYLNILIKEYSSFFVYDLEINYNNPYNQELVLFIGITADNFTFNIALTVPGDENIFKVVSCTNSISIGEIESLSIGSGSGKKIIGNTQTITVPSNINSYFDFDIIFNYIEGTTIEDLYIRCYGDSGEYLDYIQVEGETPSSLFISSSIEESDENYSHYSLENIKVSLLNILNLNLPVPLYFAYLTQEEDLEFLSSNQSLYDWIYSRKKATEFPILKVVISIVNYDWTASLKLLGNSSGNYISAKEINTGNNYVFELIPNNAITSDGIYNFLIELRTTNASEELGSIDNDVAPEIEFDFDNNGLFLLLTEILESKVSGNSQKENVYKIKIAAELSASYLNNIFNRNIEYPGYFDLKIFEVGQENTNTVTIKIIPRNLAIYLRSSTDFNYVDLVSTGPQEIVSMVDNISGSCFEYKESFSNFSNINYGSPVSLPVGTLYNCSRKGLDIPKLTLVNSAAWPKDPDYFYGLLRFIFHFNDASPNIYIITRFDDWLEGIYINRDTNNTVPSPQFAYNKWTNPGSKGKNDKNLNWGELFRRGPIQSNLLNNGYLKNGLNTIEFLARNPTGDGFFQCAVTANGYITVDNYSNSPWNYKKDLTKNNT